MANKPFDRTVINPRERPLSSDINQAQSQGDRNLREYLRSLFGVRSLTTAPDARAILSGFVSDGFKLDAGSGLQVVLRQGVGFQDGTGDQPSSVGGVIGLDDLEAYKPLYLATSVAAGLSAADPTNPRYDLVEVKYKRALGNPLSRDVLDTGSGAFVPTLVQKTMSFELAAGDYTLNGTGNINVKTGTPAGSPTLPSVDAGYIPVGYVYVPANAISLDATNLIDARRMLSPGGLITCGFYGKFNFDVADGGFMQWVSGHWDLPPGFIGAAASTAGSTPNNTITLYLDGPSLRNLPAGTAPLLLVSLSHPAGALNNKPMLASVTAAGMGTLGGQPPSGAFAFPSTPPLFQLRQPSYSVSIIPYIYDTSGPQWDQAAQAGSRADLNVQIVIPS